MTEDSITVNELAEYESDAAAIIAFAENRTAHHVAKIADITDGLEMWVNSRGLETFTVDRRHHAPAPARMTGTTQLETIAAFCDWVDAHRTTAGDLTDLDVYADLPSMVITAILNPGTIDGPGWQDYRAVVRLTYTPEWQAWSKLHGKYLEQAAFGAFVADWSHTFVSPPGGDMAHLAENLVIHAQSRVANAVRLRDGSRRIVFEEREETRDADGNDFDVPAEIILRFPIFDGGDVIEIPALFRFQRRGGEVSFGVHFGDIAGLTRNAFDSAIAHASAALGVTVYAGTAPESTR